MQFTLSHRKIRVTATGAKVGTGWLPPYSTRGTTRRTTPRSSPSRQNWLRSKARKAKTPHAAPPSVDLRPWCSPIENQLGLGSCSAHAAMGVVEYFERRAFGKHVDGSRL